MLIHILRNVGHIEVRVALIGELFELGVERLSGEACLIAKVMETADTVLGIVEVVILDKAKTFAKVGLVIDDCLRAQYVPKTITPTLEHFIGCLWKQATNVDICLAVLILEATI